MSDSIFTKILKGEIAGYKIYEDEDFFGLLDIHPKTRGHSLIIPKKEAPDVFEMDDQTLSKLMPAAKKLAQKLKEKLGADAIKFIQNNGSQAGQEVFHYHMHVIPYYEDKSKSEGKTNFEEIVQQINS